MRSLTTALAALLNSTNVRFIGTPTITRDGPAPGSTAAGDGPLPAADPMRAGSRPSGESPAASCRHCGRPITSSWLGEPGSCDACALDWFCYDRDGRWDARRGADDGLREA